MKSRCAAFQVQACQQEFMRGYLPHTANAPAMECQVSRPAQQAREAACLRFRLPGISWHDILPLLPYGTAKSEQAEIFTGPYLRLVKSCWELISVWDFCGLEGIVCDYFVLFLQGKTALPLPRKKVGKVPLTHI